MLCLAEEVDSIIVWVIVFQNPKLQLPLAIFCPIFYESHPKSSNCMQDRSIFHWIWGLQ